MSRQVDIDVSDFREFFTKMEGAGKDMKKELELWLEAVGYEFLRVIQDEIVRREVVDTRLLLHSFEKGDGNNIWDIEDDGLVLEVGSSVEYASFVNDGHWTIDPSKDGHFTLSDGSLARFVPGQWEGDRFIYDPSSNSGMVLRQQWVDGKPYFDSALRIMDKMFPELLEEKMQQWLDEYF